MSGPGKKSGNSLIVREAGWIRNRSAAFEHVTSDEVRRLIGAAPTERTRLLLKILWATGARISEVMDLSAADFDAVERALTIQRKQRQSQYRQALPIPADPATELHEYIRVARRQKKIFSGDRSSAYRTIRALGEKVLGRRITPHCFRHGKAYAMVQRGVHPLLVSRALGHTNLSSAVAYYNHSEQDLRRALEESI